MEQIYNFKKNYKYIHKKINSIQNYIKIKKHKMSLINMQINQKFFNIRRLNKVLIVNIKRFVDCTVNCIEFAAK